MPKVLQRDPAWLCRGSPGFQLFRPDNSPKAPHPAGVRYDGPLRKIAHRGTEVFVAVGQELRWSDLSLLKDAGEEQKGCRGLDNERDGGAQMYRVLKTPVFRPITQLSISPSGDYIAILTSHTCHVCILPAAERLQSNDLSPLKLRSFQLGPTAHVLEQSPLVSAIWHPLSPYGDCLVTVTRDACVRLWELDKDNRSTFDEPSLAVDLKKLANATSIQADFSASKYGISKGFSPDNEEMQVAAACFGGRGGDDEHGWASMTIWVAMVEGDIYALCPFLPSKWRAAATMLPSLSTSVVAKARALSRDGEATESQRKVSDQQSKWLAELDVQDPLLVPGANQSETIEVYSRPERPGSIPKLQGPFQVSPELDAGDVTDIHVIAPRIGDEELFDEDSEDVRLNGGLSVGIICLATSAGKVHVCLEMDGVEAEWLPNKRSRTFSPDDVEKENELLLFETVDLDDVDQQRKCWTTFSPSPIDRYELFTTQPRGVYGLSFRPWIGWLEDELANPTDAGMNTRITTLLESARTLIDQPIRLPTIPERGINAAIALTNINLGYLVLTSAMDNPFSAILDQPHTLHPFAPDTSRSAPLPAPEPRSSYQPADDFFQPSALPQLIKTVNERKTLGSNLNTQIRFNPATLQLMTEAHRILSSETHKLGMAAADLFRRCERMRFELEEQVRKVREINDKANAVISPEHEDGDLKARVENRIELNLEKTIGLNVRMERVRKKMLRLGGKQLSAKEMAFAEEVDKLESSILPVPEAPTDPNSLLHMANSASSTSTAYTQWSSSRGQNPLANRFDAVQALHDELIQQAQHAAELADMEQERDIEKAVSGGGLDFRKHKLQQVLGLLERETALVDAVTERLGRLSRGLRK